MKVLLYIIVLFLLIQVAYAQEQLSFDGFETGTFCGGIGWTDACWTTAGSTALVGWNNPYEGNRHVWLRTSTGVLSRSVYTTGYGTVSVGFAYRVNSFEGGDRATFSIIVDGGAPIVIKEWTPVDSDNQWHYVTYDISEYVGESLTLDFRSHMSDFGDEIHFDNIEVIGEVGVVSEVNLFMEQNYPVGMTNVPITMTSTETNTLHTVKLYDGSGVLFCEKNAISPSVSGTIFVANCDLPSTPSVDARAEMFVTNDPTINNTRFFHIVDYVSNPDLLRINHVYYPEMILQGSNIEIFATVQNLSSPISSARAFITYPNNQTRILSLYPTINQGEYRAFITDTFRIGTTNFTLQFIAGDNVVEYTNQYFVAPYTIDYVDNVGSIGYVDFPTMQVHGTEYSPGDFARTFIQLLDGQNFPIENSSCYVSIYYPYDLPFVSNQAMSYLSEGLYYYDFQVPYVNGVYMISSYCVIEGLNVSFQTLTDDFEPLIYDNFETNTFSGGAGWIESSWTTAGSTALRGFTDPYDGNRHVWLRSNTGVLSRSVNTSNFGDDAIVSFAVKVNSLEGADKAYFNVIVDDGSPVLIKQWDSTDSDNIWKYQSYRMSDYGVTLGDKLEIEFLSDMSDLGDEMHFDLIKVIDTGVDFWANDWVTGGARFTLTNPYQGLYSLGIEGNQVPYREINSSCCVKTTDIAFRFRATSLEVGDSYYIRLIDASNVGHLLREVTSTDSDGIWKSYTGTIHNTTFDFNGTLKFTVENNNVASGDYLYLDNINIVLNLETPTSETEYQVVRGSGEAHVTNGGYYEKHIVNGTLYNNTFLDGFDIYYNVISLVPVFVDNQKIELELYEPFPCNHVTNVTYQNGTGYEEVSGVSYKTEHGRCHVVFEYDLDVGQQYVFKITSENFWKQQLLSEYYDNFLLQEFIEIGCVNYQTANSLSPYSVPYSGNNHSDDAFYTSCLHFFDAYYDYDDEIQTQFLPFIYDIITFTPEEMDSLEAFYMHLIEEGNNIKNYALSIANGLQLGADYSVAILADPYPPPNPNYAKYFANISTSYLTYLALTVGFSEMSPGVTYIGGTEYTYGEEGRIAVRIVKNNGDAETGATCTVSALYPNQTLFITTQSMSEYGQGIYSYNFTIPETSGIYIYFVDCDNGGRNYKALSTFHVTDYMLELSNIRALLEEMNVTFYQLNEQIINDTQELIYLHEVLQNLTIQNNTVLYAKLLYLQELMEHIDSFNSEMIFLITDSVVKAERIMNGQSDDVGRDLEGIRDNLSQIEEQEKEENNILLYSSFGFVFVIITLFIYRGLANKRREKHEKNNDYAINTYDGNIYR